MFFELSRKSWVASILTLICVFFLIGCAGRVPPLEVAPPKALQTRQITVNCGIDSTRQWTYKEYQLPSTILQANIDPNGEHLILVCSSEAKKRWDLYDISTQKDEIENRFHVPNGSMILCVAADAAALQEAWKGMKFIIVNLDSGKIAVDVSSTFLKIPQENRALISQKGMLQLWEVSTANKLWERPWSLGYSPQTSIYRTGERVFVVGDGLLCANLDDGDGWSLDLKVWHKNVAKQVAREVAGAIFGVLTGTYVSGGNPDIISGLHSNPLVVGDLVLFSSEDYLSCLSLEKGEVVWQKEYEDDAGTSCLYQLDSLGILVDYGTKLFNGQLRETKRPYVSAFSLSTGEERWHLVPEPLCPIEEVLVWSDYILMTTQSSFYVVDKKGQLLRNYPSDGELKPSKLMNMGDVLVISHGDSLTAWGDSLNVLWHQKKGYSGLLGSNRSLGWNDILDSYHVISLGAPSATTEGGNRDQLTTDDSRIWAVDNGVSRRLTAYNLATGQPEISISFDATLQFFPNHLLLVSNDRVGVFKIASLFKEVQP